MATINNITEDYCSFEVSKLLKEKGFQVPTVFYFRITGDHMFPQPNPFNHNDDSKNETASGMTFVSAPTHAIAIKWILKNYGISISVDNLIDNKFYFSYRDTKSKDYASRTGCAENGYDTSEEATEAALLYTLQNLIK